MVAGRDAGKHDGDAAALELCDGVAEESSPGGIDRADPGHTQNDDLDVGDLGELKQQSMRRGEKERTVDAIRDDVLTEERVFLGRMVTSLERDHLDALKTAIVMGEARGAALLVAAEYGLDIFEMAPRRVKQAIVGYGGAQKLAVAKMIQRMLSLQDLPEPDAADALALALAYLQESGKPTLSPLEKI